VADLGPFSLLDASATWDPATGQLTLAVVNRERERSHLATIDLGDAMVTGGVLISDVSGPEVGTVNSFERPDAVGVQERRREGGGATLDYDFPAHSLSVLRMQVR